MTSHPVISMNATNEYYHVCIGKTGNELIPEDTILVSKKAKGLEQRIMKAGLELKSRYRQVRTALARLNPDSTDEG